MLSLPAILVVGAFAARTNTSHPHHHHHHHHGHPAKPTGKQPFWGCGLLGPLPGIDHSGNLRGDIRRMVDGLKVTSQFNKVSIWNWDLYPHDPKDGDMEYFGEDFLFMPEQWGVEPVKKHKLREAGKVGFLDENGKPSRAQMDYIFLGANEPDITGSCMGSMMGACRKVCTKAEVLAHDCPTAHLNQPQGTGKPNSRGACNCWSDSHATGVGYWPVKKIKNRQPLPKCWDNPECVSVQMSNWRATAKTAVAKGYKYLTTPLVAVHMDYIRKFIIHACDGCSDISCGCPTHIGWHFYANDCLAGGMSGYDSFKHKLRKTVEIMTEFPWIQGAIVNEVGMLNCDMSTASAICVPNGPGQKYPALDYPNHDCPSTPALPNGFATFIEHLLHLVSHAKTADGRQAVVGFTWFNEDMSGGTYNLRLFNNDTTMNAAGHQYIKSCQKWARGVMR